MDIASPTYQFGETVIEIISEWWVSVHFGNNNKQSIKMACVVRGETSRLSPHALRDRKKLWNVPMQLCKTNKVLRFSIPKYDSVSNYYKMFKGCSSFYFQIKR